MKRWILPLFVVVLAALYFTTNIGEQLDFERLQAEKDNLLEYVEAHRFIAAAAFFLIYTAGVALSLPFATVMTLLGGFLFGLVWGALLVIGAATMGASIVFLIARSSVGHTLRERAGPLYHKISKNMEDNAVGYMLFMRLVPLFPFFLVNIVPALFNVRLRSFMVTTLVGIAPGTIVYVNVGRQLGEIDGLSGLISVETLTAFTLLGFVALTPTLYRQIKRKRNDQKL